MKSQSEGKKVKEKNYTLRINWTKSGYDYQIIILEGSDKFNLSICKVGHRRDFPSTTQQILIPVSGIEMLIKYLQSL